jgi:hypothetical protein
MFSDTEYMPSQNNDSLSSFAVCMACSALVHTAAGGNSEKNVSGKLQTSTFPFNVYQQLCTAECGSQSAPRNVCSLFIVTFVALRNTCN